MKKIYSASITPFDKRGDVDRDSVWSGQKYALKVPHFFSTSKTLVPRESAPLSGGTKSRIEACIERFHEYIAGISKNCHLGTRTFEKPRWNKELHSGCYVEKVVFRCALE